MSVKIIYGRSGSGKTEYIYNSILKNIDGDKRQYIITPEQFSYTAEKRLIDSLEEGATTKVEVLSFERMAYRVMNEVFPKGKKNITKAGKAMIVLNSINKNKSKLKFLGKSLENIEMILTQITEFKKHNITVEMLENAIERLNNEYLKIKLEDMIILYKDLEDKISDEFIDENDMLTILVDNIEKSHLFDNAIFYIDEFAGFTKQEYSVIEKINEIASEVFVTVCTDELKIYKAPEADVFYDNKQTVQTLVGMFDLEKEKQICLDKTYRFKNEELAHLEKNIFNIPYEQYDKECKNIKLTLADNNYEEVEYVASEILNLVKNENYRYRDIAVISNNTESYNGLCKAIFGEYNIPVFIDEKIDITQNVLIKYVLSIIDILAKNWSYESVFNYLKTGLVDVDNLYELEKYCLKWGIKGKKWYEKPWDYEEENYNKEQNDIVTPLINLSDSLNKKKTVRELTENLYSFLVVNLMPKIQNTEDEEIISAWNIIIDVFEEMVNLFGEETISYDNYLKLLQMGISFKELGKIPESQDKVIFGDVNRSKTHKVKAVFIVGVNDGSFPSINTSEGYFNDKDRNVFKTEGIEIAKGTREKVYEENFNIYKAFTAAEEKLFVSYVSSDAEGEAQRKSLFISRLQKVFNKLEEQSVDKNQILNREATFNVMLDNLENKEWNMVYKWYEKNEPEKLERAIKGLNYTNVPERISKENIEKLYGNTFKTTISKMESYMSCPFSYFLQYGLKIKEDEKLEIQSLDTGSFMHAVIDEFFKTAVSRNNDISENKVSSFKEINDEEVEKIINEIIEEQLEGYMKFKLTAKARILIQRLNRVILLSIKYIIDSLKNSEFEILGNEISFGANVPKANSEENIDYKSKNYPPIKIELSDGKKIIIEGKIDRVDIARLPDGNYIRVIDYKSSAKDLELHKVLAGLQLQLITYVDAVCKNEDVMPAGALYYGLLEPKLDVKNKNIEKEELEKILKQNYKMSGYVLADINVIKAMDKTLENGKSDVVPVTLNKNGDISYSNSKVMTSKEFENMQKYVEKLIKEISKEILSGDIGLKPYYLTNKKSTPCQYCKYKSVCQFDTKFKNNDYRIIIPDSKEEVLSKMEAELK